MIFVVSEFFCHFDMNRVSYVSKGSCTFILFSITSDMDEIEVLKV